MQKELLKLFNAVHVEEESGRTKQTRRDAARTIKNGYILHPVISPTDDLLDSIESVVGISGEKANSCCFEV